MVFGGTKALAEFKTLTALDLTGNEIGVKGEIILAKFSSQNNLEILISDNFQSLLDAYKKGQGTILKI